LALGFGAKLSLFFKNAKKNQKFPEAIYQCIKNNKMLTINAYKKIFVDLST
jgi:hypothetical protein